jgi:hypothetical protein
LQLLPVELLESILAFLTIGELHTGLSVSKEWNAAIMKMPPIGAELPVALVLRHDDPDLTAVSGRSLARHIGSIMRPFQVFVASAMKVLADHLPGLQELAFRLPGIEPIELPPNLTKLHILLTSNHTEASAQQIVDSVGCLQQLQELKLGVLGLSATRISLSPIEGLQSLTTLNIVRFGTYISDAQVQQLRRMTRLTSIAVLTQNSRMSQLFALPHQWRLTSLDAVGDHRDSESDQHSVSAVEYLPTLTHLRLSNVRISRLDFLAQLPLLKSLWLAFEFPRGVAVDRARVVTALQRCTQLTELWVELWDPPTHLTADDLAACLPHMPQLRTLDVRIKRLGVSTSTFHLVADSRTPAHLQQQFTLFALQLR